MSMDSVSKAIEAVIAQLPHLEFRLGEPMKKHTSFRIGAPVRAMLFPKTTQEMAQLSGTLSRFGIVPLIFGNGTNLLVDDRKTLEMIAVKTTGVSEIVQTGETQITAAMGASLSRLAVFACECGLTGLEFAHGIPGSLGGAVSINAGAYGREMKDIVLSTDAISDVAGFYCVAGEEHGFSYRHSRFTDANDIVLSSTLLLQKSDEDKIKAKMGELAERRRESQPLDSLSAGSTFKRPKGGYAATLIEQAGLKGFSIGEAQVSEKHAGFVVNNGAATFGDVMAVIDHVRETVFARFGVELELENKIVRS